MRAYRYNKKIVVVKCMFDAYMSVGVGLTIRQAMSVLKPTSTEGHLRPLQAVADALQLDTHQALELEEIELE